MTAIEKIRKDDAQDVIIEVSRTYKSRPEAVQKIVNEVLVDISLRIRDFKEAEDATNYCECFAGRRTDYGLCKECDNGSRYEPDPVISFEAEGVVENYLNRLTGKDRYGFFADIGTVPYWHRSF